MKINKEGILRWCDSVEKELNPREHVPREVMVKMISEQFLATSIRYLRALCEEKRVVRENPKDREENWDWDSKSCKHEGEQCSCVCHEPNNIILHDYACCHSCFKCGFRDPCKVP